MWLDFALDSFAILALEAHRAVVQLAPEAGGAWDLRKGACGFMLDAVANDDFDVTGVNLQ